MPVVPLITGRELATRGDCGRNGRWPSSAFFAMNIRVERTDSNLGFDGRRFLTASEWKTYLRRRPVRYIRKGKRAVCEICGRAGTPDDPLQNAHRI